MIHWIIALLPFVISSVIGLNLTSPPEDSTLAADGLHEITWIPDPTTDPPFMDIVLINVNNSSINITIALDVPTNSSSFDFSLTLPTGSGYVIQCTQVDDLQAVIAQIGPFSISGDPDPFVTVVDGTTTIPPGETVSTFSAPAGTESFPVSTITDAVSTISFVTTTLVVSSIFENVSTTSTLTTTITEYSTLTNATSTGSILIPIASGNDPPPDPLNPDPLLHPPLETPEQAPFITIAGFRKWKRVADGTSVTAAAVTITGTRGKTTTEAIITPGTTISAAPPPTSTVTQPALTVTVSPSVVTVPPTIVTITATPRNSTVIGSPQPPIRTVPGVSTQQTTILTTQSGTIVPIVTVLGTQCAICTSGLINAGNRIGGGWSVLELVGWGIWVVIVAVVVR